MADKQVGPRHQRVSCDIRQFAHFTSEFISFAFPVDTGTGMKKQKAKDIKTEAGGGSELELAIIADGSKGEAWLKEHIFKRLGRPRADATLYVARVNPEVIQSWKELAEWVAQGRVVAGDAALIRDKIRDGKPAWVFLADEDNAHILGHALTYFLTNKKLFRGDGVCTCRLPKGQKQGIPGSLKNGLFNLTGQWLLPTEQKQYAFPYVFFSKKVIAEQFSDQTMRARLLCARASYFDYPFSEVELTSKELLTPVYGYAGMFRDAWKSRTQWYFTDTSKNSGKAWRMAFAVLSVFALVLMLVSSQQYGMTWDEKRHNEYSKASLNYFETFGEDSTCLSETLPTQEFRYYGEHFNVIAAFLYTHILSIGEYETRHLLNALYGFLAMLFAALLAKEIASWRAAVFAFAAIFVSPVFFGHSMNNPTDIPFATGFAIAMYYLLKLFKTLPSPKTSTVLLAALGIGIAVGSRVGGVLLYAYAGLFMFIHFIRNYKQSGFTHFKSYLSVFITLLICGHLMSISLWPFGQQDIFTGWYEALKKSTEGAYFTFNHELFEGVRIYMANVPWYYLPKFILINTPLAVLIGFALSIVLLIKIQKDFRYGILVYFVLFALVFPIVYAEYQSMYYYNGWRHYLFVYPFLIVLSATGWDALIRMFKKPLVMKGVTVLFFALCLLPAFWMLRNHPYASVYFNELSGGLKGAYGRYETDYYSNSCREAGEWLANQEPKKKLIVAINNEPVTAAYYAQKINPDMEFRWVREYEEQKPFWDYAILTSRTYSQKELIEGAFPPKGTVYVVEADGVPLAAVVKRESYAMPLGYQALETKNSDSAIVYFTQATQYNPADEEAWRMLGEAYTNKGSADTALQMLQKSIELSPENYAAYNQLGLVYMNVLKDYGKAIKAFEKSTEIKFNFAEGYYYAASCYMIMQDYNKAITLLEQAIKRGGSSIPEVYYNLGASYLTVGMNKKAEENFINCLTLSPNLTMGYRALAEAFQKQGKTNEARQCMQKYRELGGQ